MTEMPLKLEKPLAFFDTETTGLNRQNDRIVELAVIKLHPDGRREERVFRCHPEQPIPPGATAIHGITDEDVKDCPPFSRIAVEVAALLADADLAGFNIIQFDIPLLEAEFRRAGVVFDFSHHRVVDVQRIFHRREPRTLSAALAFYCGRPHDGAHGALADTEATLAVLEGQFERYEDLPRDVDALVAYCHPKQKDWAEISGRLRWDEDGEMVLGFGPHEGRRLRDLASKEDSFLSWMLRKDFSEEIKRFVQDALKGVFHRRSSPGGTGS